MPRLAIRLIWGLFMSRFLVGVALGLFIGAYLAVSFPVPITNLFAHIDLAQSE